MFNKIPKRPLDNPRAPLNITMLTASDYPLKAGETVFKTYSAATSVPLNIATVEGEYEIIIKSNTVAISNSNNLILSPNNTTYTGKFDRHGTVNFSSTIASQLLTAQNTFILTGGLARYIIVQVSTSTLNKILHYKAHGVDVSNIYHAVCAEYWDDVVTSWTSLGTLTFPFAQTGTIIIKRTL